MTVDLEETRLDTALVYHGSFMQVRKDNVRLPNGATGSREYITHHGAVAELALLDHGNPAARPAPPQTEIRHGDDVYRHRHGSGGGILEDLVSKSRKNEHQISLV